MKITKIISMILMALFVFALSNCIKETKENSKSPDKELNYRTNNCVPPDYITDNHCIGPKYWKDVEITIAPYFNCKFKFDVEYYWCYDEVTHSYKAVFTDVTLTQLPYKAPPCVAFWNDIQKAIKTNLGAKTFFNNFYKKAYHEIGMKFIQNRIESIPELSYCGEASYNLITEFYPASCYRICIDLTDTSGNPWWKTPCGSDCCKMTTAYCLNRETGQIETTTTYDYLGDGTQSCEAVPGSGCPKVGQISGTCLQFCQ